MAMTLEELEKRVAALEREVAQLRQERNGTPERARAATVNLDEFRAGFAKALAGMGVRGKPIGAQKLQQMMLAAGIRPEENQFSRAIIEMREE
jgi:hypothetical protein